MILDAAKAYLTTVRRFHLHRDNPLMKGVAIRELRKLAPTPAVQKHVNRFLARNRAGSPSDGDGPRFA